MKKLLSILLTLAMLLSVTAVADNDEIKVFLDGEQIQFDVQPFIENDRTLVPMRAIFEALGVRVNYTDEFHGEKLENPIISLFKDNDDNETYTSVTITIGSNKMKKAPRMPIEGDTRTHQYINLDAPAKIVSDRTFVPLRAVSEAFDCDVQWDGDTKTVTITSEEVLGNPTYTEKLMSQLPQDENYVVSPFSLKMAMMMAANGAEGITQQEILDTFGVDDTKAFNEYSKQLIADLNADEKAEVNIANSIWFNKDIGGKNGDFSESFKKIIKNGFSGTAEAVTNRNSVERVNEWTEQQTNGKIKNLLDEDSRDYLAALVNTVYMKAEWQKKFIAEFTGKDIFTDIDGKENKIDFMYQTAHFDYFENGDTWIVRMPYTNGMSMYVVLGDTKNFEKNIKKMTTKKVRLSLPKFKIDYSIELKDILQNMGVKSAFMDDNYDFDSMVKNVLVSLKIDSVLQKAVIEADEEGTEAAAATVVEMVGSDMPQPEEIVEFKADKPFTYYILDDTSDEVLFAGRYVKPE